MGNPGLWVLCSTSNGSSCTTNHNGSRHSILFIALGFVGFVICLSEILLIYDHHSRHRSNEGVLTYPNEQIYIHQMGQRPERKANFADYKLQEASYSNDEGDFRIINLMNVMENFHDRYIIGEGGHGIVYKAKLDIGVFAIKKVNFGQSNRRKVNMIREIEMTRKIRHQNAARCLGSWMGEEYGLTISRYMENGSLHDVLHENDPLPYLAWNVRYKIAIGIAKGLAYLHHDCDPPILHRDIKPKNILPDSEMQPRITDFGISIALNQSTTTMHIRSTYHLGTLGFMAPEIACVIVPSCELDIYSYGVVLLELITRKKVLDSSFMVEETTLVGWFKSVWRTTRELEEIVDSSIARELSDLNVMVQVIKVILVALICTETDPGKRLKMRDVVEFFETSTDPGIFVRYYGEFHLGSSLATAAASMFFQEEATIPANRDYSSILHEVMEATANPNNLNIIGRGTHGVVYEVPLGQDLVYAVKKLEFAGNKRKIQTIVREIKILIKIRHRNLVGLLDFSFTKNYGIILYSYMPNGNLHDVLHEKNPPLSLVWTVRHKIAAGIAHGLAYLHYDCYPAILHRAIKPKNILLDYDMEPRIADFSIAKLLDQSSSRPSSSVPENTYSTANTRESDVYSFGVVLLELITRKKAVDPSFMEGTEIVGWVKTLWQETGGIYKIIDSSLVEEVMNPNILKQVINVLLVALRCTEEDPDMRPTMRDVINQLEDAYI